MVRHTSVKPIWSQFRTHEVQLPSLSVRMTDRSHDGRGGHRSGHNEFMDFRFDHIIIWFYLTRTTVAGVL